MKIVTHFDDTYTLLSCCSSTLFDEHRKVVIGNHEFVALYYKDVFTGTTIFKDAEDDFLTKMDELERGEY